jgi:hypothetical protein
MSKLCIPQGDGTQVCVEWEDYLKGDMSKSWKEKNIFEEQGLRRTKDARTRNNRKAV